MAAVTSSLVVTEAAGPGTGAGGGGTARLDKPSAACSAAVVAAFVVDADAVARARGGAVCGAALAPPGLPNWLGVSKGLPATLESGVDGRKAGDTELPLLLPLALPLPGRLCRRFRFEVDVCTVRSGLPPVAATLR